MNMVRYAPGEMFDEHHDGQFRPITIFVYLNELPEHDEAGDTFFPSLGVSFKPRRGTAVMWSNVLNGEEDQRLLHTGRAPNYGIKYGVNCFFNVREMRHLTPVVEDYLLQDAVAVVLANLSEDEGEQGERPETCKPVAYRLSKEPQVVAIPSLLTEHEALETLQLASCGKVGVQQDEASGNPFAGGTRTLFQLDPASTPFVAMVEERIAGCAGLGLELLGGLRVVTPGIDPGLCNRGCGPKSGYVCLSEQDELFFLRLGLRLVLRRGDAVLWSNVDWETGFAVEDVRTLRAHLQSGEARAPTIGLDIFFHDNAVREQQKTRRFVHDPAAAAHRGDAVIATPHGEVTVAVAPASDKTVLGAYSPGHE
jgi:hypothetical protein